MTELNLDDLAVFVRVVERGGFASAARELGEPTSTVSRAIGRLEAKTGLRLLHRTTRNVRPTGDGRELYASIAPAIAALRSATHALEPATRKPKGRLRLTAPPDLATSFLADVLVAFVERYPLVQVDLVSTNEHVNLVDDGFDMALRVAPKLADSSLVARKLGDLALGLFASPKYLEVHGTPSTLEDLEGHRCVVFRAKELTRTWGSVEVRGRVGGDDFSFVRALVAAGGGIGLMPHINAAGDEGRGRLVRVLPSFAMKGASLFVVVPSARNVPARVTAFRDFVSEAFERWNAGSEQSLVALR